MSERAGPRALALSAATLGWICVPLALGLDRSTAVGLPAFALVLGALLLWLDRRKLGPLLRFDPRGALIGLAAGAVMAAATYPAFAVSVRLFPPLAAQVASAYRPLTVLAPWEFLPRLLVVVFVEELLWRGSWLELAALQPRTRFAVAWGVYVLAQLGLGAWVAALLAAACGAAWLGLRRLTCGLWAPIFAHAVWSATVLLFFPVGPPPGQALVARVRSVEVGPPGPDPWGTSRGNLPCSLDPAFRRLPHQGPDLGGPRFLDRTRSRRVRLERVHPGIEEELCGSVTAAPGFSMTFFGIRGATPADVWVAGERIASTDATERRTSALGRLCCLSEPAQPV